ncbi:hypothetical protein GCM10027517_06550 [Phycicoccus ginsengisoli]
MPRIRVGRDRTGVGATPEEAVAGDPSAFVLPMPRVTVVVPAVMAALMLAFSAYGAVLALRAASLFGLAIIVVLGAGALLALRQVLRASRVPQLAVGPKGVYFSGLGIDAERRACVVPWQRVARLVACQVIERDSTRTAGRARREALALVVQGTGPDADPLVAPPLSHGPGLQLLMPGSVDLSALDPGAPAELRRTRPDVLAMLEAAGAGGAGATGNGPRLPYQRLARQLRTEERAALTAAVRRYAPRVEVVDGPDIDTRGPSVWVGPPTG